MEGGKNVKLSTLVNYSSKFNQERLLGLFFMLSQFTPRHGSGENEEWEGLSKESIELILAFVIPLIKPRFLFALGSNSTILRSPDKGKSWKLIFKLEKKKVEEKNNTEDDELSEITNLMKEVETKALGKKEEAKENILWLVCSRDMVVGGGSKRYLCASVDRGINFTESTTALESHLPPGACLDAAALNGEGSLVVASGNSLFSVELVRSGFSKVDFGKVSLIFSAQGRIGAIQSQKRGQYDELIVSEVGALHISLDYGKNFHSIPHALGTIRSVDWLNGMRNSCLPQFPAECRVLQSAAKPAKANSEGGTTEKYEYAVGLRRGLSAQDEALLSKLESQYLTTGGDHSFFYRYFLVCGTGAEVLPFDYSALLCVAFQMSGETFRTFTIASAVDYVPYIKSGPRESLMCASYKMENSGDVVFVRGNSGGVSFCVDRTKWSPPQKSAVVGLNSCDCAGECLVSCLRNTIHLFGPSNSVTTVPIPADLRVPSLVSVVGC